MRIRVLLLTISTVCALLSGAQTLTATYIEYADSADRYIKLDRWDDAERVIVKALRHEPANKSNYLLWSNLGIVRTNLGKYNEALQAYEAGLASAPRSTMLLTNRAKTLMKMGRNGEALADLDQVLQLDSTLQWPRKMRGLLRAVDNDIAGARADFAEYKRLFGPDASVAETEGDIANTVGDGDAALESYREAYALEPEAQLLCKMLITAQMYGKLEQMEDLLTEGLKKYPREGTLYLMRALMNKNKFQTESMEHDLKTARDLGVDEFMYQRILEQAGIKIDKK